MHTSFQQRRNFMDGAAGAIAPLLANQAHGQSADRKVSLPPVDAPADRVGFAQNICDPNQWRLKRAPSGGGAMSYVGIYCLDTARFQALCESAPANGRALRVAAPTRPVRGPAPA